MLATLGMEEQWEDTIILWDVKAGGQKLAR
jgi:hypothetical protein